ncbi:MAG: aspartate--ammonia ligase [Fidelibacterota bacterium]
MYKSKLDLIATETGIKLIKDTFERKLAEKLSLQRVSAPRFIRTGKGLQDDLDGSQIPVSFSTRFTDHAIEMVHSLAKWKRYALEKYCFQLGTGLYTDMDAIRKDEYVDNIHSIYVDQWDWELVISEEQRNIPFLKKTVKKLYTAIREIEKTVEETFPSLSSRLPEKITFIHSEELEDMYPGLSPKERENKITEKHKAVFVIGIGHPLRSGEPHDIRAADYDDWSTATGSGTRGLNGDILFWDDVRESVLEISSMGIRVDTTALLKQLAFAGCEDRKELDFHKKVITKKLPLSAGGGIGQSRLCMYLLQKIHIGEVQVSVWPDEMIRECAKKKINLL